MTDTTQIHQTLHGYSRGHRLLAASRLLNADAESQLLMMSDFAGTRIISGFESYFTGYPLASTSLYALAQTWYAPEMPRPGSVWTHTLLLPEGVVATLDLEQLVALPFQRPDYPLQSSSYGKSIEFSHARTGGARQPAIDVATYHEFASALYGHPDAVIVTYVHSAEEVRDLFFRLWLQQWPAMRGRFTFSTGSLSPRFVLNSPMSLQAAPAVEQFSWSRQLSASYVEVHPGLAPIPKHGWVRPLLNDLQHSQRDFRAFLSAFSVDVAPARESMAPLCRAFVAMNRQEPDSSAEVIERLSFAFPEPSSASLLKRAFLAFDPLPGILPPASPLTVSRRLEELFVRSQPRAFAVEHIDIEQLTALLLHPLDDGIGEHLLSVLGSNTHNPLVVAVVSRLTETLTISQMVTLAKRHAGTLHLLVSQRPSLALINDLWRVSASARAEIVDAIPEGGQSDKIAWPLIQQAMKLSHDELAETLLARFSEPAVSGLLDALGDQQLSSEISPGWRRAVARRHTEIAKWVLGKVEPGAAVYAIAQLLDRNSVAAWELSIDAAEKLADGVRTALPPEGQLVAAFLVSKAMSERRVEWRGVLTKTFSIVYQAAARDQLSYLELVWLERCLPEVPGWKRWDRCYRLRKALVELVLNDEWPETILLDATTEPDIIKAVFDLLETKGRPRDVLRRLVSLISTNPAFGYILELANKYT